MKTEIRTCPKCSKTYSGRPAISRDDNSTPICPDCGIRESLQSLSVSEIEQEKILSIIHRHSRS
ncbi:MAG: hypothetical protein NC548_34155 [Lachnospiraceae bacterium]|nr:hypothetical protein [Lachnospiraceae bacterium]MCM1230009.1 hypothetical protein [Ruminococcus flavefaciens]